jgi:hypothetical protein
MEAIESNGQSSMAWFQDHFMEVLKDVPPHTWAALSDDRRRVLAYGKDADEVTKRANALGEPAPHLLRVPDWDDFVAGPLVGKLELP